LNCIFEQLKTRLAMLIQEDLDSMINGVVSTAGSSHSSQTVEDEQPREEGWRCSVKRLSTVSQPTCEIRVSFIIGSMEGGENGLKSLVMFGVLLVIAATLIYVMPVPMPTPLLKVGSEQALSFRGSLCQALNYPIIYGSAAAGALAGVPVGPWGIVSGWTGGLIIGGALAQATGSCPP